VTIKQHRSGKPRRDVKVARPRSLLVFVEGEKTEPGYLTYFKREYRHLVIVTVDPFHGGPLQLVERAIKNQKDEAYEAKRGRGSAHDEYWCMFDVDEHPNLPQAIKLAGENRIHLAISSPCIELWFILHFNDQTAHIDRTKAQIQAKLLTNCEKTLTPAAIKDLEENYLDAKRRAKSLDIRHGDNESPVGENPSSGVWRLIDSIRRDVKTP